jgi:hypothetical protein
MNACQNEGMDPPLWESHLRKHGFSPMQVVLYVLPMLYGMAPATARPQIGRVAHMLMSWPTGHAVPRTDAILGDTLTIWTVGV